VLFIARSKLLKTLSHSIEKKKRLSLSSIKIAMANLLQYTSLDSIQDYVSHVRQIFHTGKPRDLKWRKHQIQRLYDMISENEERFYESLRKDMNKPRNEAMSGDIVPVLDECLYFLDVSIYKVARILHLERY
jgi:acyl-CoA reductase-like NAD-dependent aldehyde dehydrogenase